MAVGMADGVRTTIPIFCRGNRQEQRRRGTAAAAALPHAVAAQAAASAETLPLGDDGGAN